MNKILTRVLCGIMVAVLLAGFLAMLIPSNAAEATVYRYGPNNVIYNWGERGEDATSLSPNAIAFYNSNGVTYEELAALSGSSTVSSVPSSALYTKLRNLMTINHDHQTSYNETRDLYQYTDCMNNGLDANLGAKISSFYSGIGVGPSWDSGNTWNREHTWPNSKGDANGNGENDIIMLRPTAATENTSRGNKAYGETAGTKFYDPNAKSGGTYNLHGDVARIVLYVYVRWQNTSASNAVLFGENGVMESRDVLLKWLAEDPVDTWEMGRNDSVESITGTRNVFVDYPELAFKLLGAEVPADLATPSNGTGTGTAPTPPAPVVVPETVTQPAAGTAYKLFMNQSNLNSVLFFNGQTENANVTYRLATTTNAADAVEVFLEAATGGYHLYFMNGNTKTYIRIYERTDDVAGKGKGSLELVTEAPAEVLTYDATVNTLVYTADDGENAYYLGTYSNYSTFSVSNTYYITGDNAANVDESQFPARFADASFQGGGNVTPENPEPSEPTDPTEPEEPDVPTDTGVYTKINTIDALTSGQYVMTVSTGFAPGVVDGTWITAVEPTVSGNTVTNSKGGVWTLSVEGNTVTLQDANGVYVGPRGGNFNGITTGTPYQWEVSCQNGEFTFKGTGADTVALASNTDPEYGNKFRGYKTTTIADAAAYPSAFTLYKGDGSGTVTPPPVEPDVPDVPDVPEVPEYTMETVANPVAGTAYKLYMNKTGEGKILFFNGQTESETVTYRLATTTDPREAVDVYLETVTGGYRLYFMNDGVKTYIRVYERKDGDAGKGSGSLEFVTEAPAEVLTYDATANTLIYAPDAENAYYMGTYSTYTTFSVSNTFYITGDNAANVDVTQYPARFALVTQEEAPAEPVIKNGWVQENGTWYFYENGTMVKNDWRKDSIGWCYLLADGKMAVNKWQMDSKGWCYLGADGYCVTNTWKKDSIGWCYLNAQGRMATNAWIKDSVGWCYVGADGYCVTNSWKRDSVGWCYLDAQGRMVVNNWVLDGGKWYYLDASGYMLANTSRNIGGKTYRFNASGVCTNP